jgi:hypothetical protein
MSQMGHSRPNWAIRLMSGLPPIATELRTWLEVRFVPFGSRDRYSITALIVGAGSGF